MSRALKTNPMTLNPVHPMTPSLHVVLATAGSLACASQRGRASPTSSLRAMASGLLGAALLVASVSARADAVDSLREFVRDVKSGKASFTQTVVSADGARRRNSSGSFEFARPNRFRFAYNKPFEQVIVADGQKVWIFDADLNQASSRKVAAAIGSTPAALLAGASLEAEFDVKNDTGKDASKDGLEWAVATPKAKDGPFQSMRVGFRGKDLAVVEITDSFGQRSTLVFKDFAANAKLADERFRFVPPPGADVIEQ
jgi:outer membrane lipoprotein carrier protein